MSTQPANRASTDQAASDPAPLLATATAVPAGPAEDLTTGEIAEFLHHLASFRSPALGGDPADHAALLARKTDLVRRITDQHTPTTASPPPTTPHPRAPAAPEGRTP